MAKTNVLGKLFVRFSIAFYHLFGAFFKRAEYFFGSFVFLKFTFNNKKIGAMFYILCGHGVKVAFAKAQVVNGIQNIGLSYPIIAHQTVDDRVEFQGLGIKVFVID